MSRILWALYITIAAISSVIALSFAANNPGRATAAAPWQGPSAPAVSCDFTLLNFNLLGTGSVGATHPISITAGDTFEQFIATPITSTADSLAYAIVNNNFSGSVTGGVIGTFSLANLNGLLITSPEGSPTNPRGFELNDIVIRGATGTITAVMAINIAALSSTPPYFPRGFNGYLHSTSTSGSYTAYKYNGAVAGTISSTGGVLTITAAVIGRLYAGGGSLSESVFAARTLPSNRSTAFDPTDMIAQFHLPDFTVGASAPGHVTPRNNMIGTTVGTINGGFVMDHEAMVVDGGTNTGKGWFAGEFTFSDSGGDLLTGPWLADLSNNSMVGYVWQVVGTGVYTDSLLFGTVNGSFFPGGTSFTGNISGVYCEGSQIPTPTATVSPTPTETGLPVPTNTDTPTALATLIPTDTATPTSIATLTATPCSMNFTDVSPSDYFYEAVRYLYCAGVISGYSDNTFRPYNNTTRAQLSKIIVLAEGWPIDTNGGPHFSDVSADNPFYDYIETAYNRGIITGYNDGTFRPTNNVTRAQLSKIIVLAQQWPIDTDGGPHFSDVPPDNPFYDFIETAYNRGIISGYNDGTFRPSNSATRGQICKIVYQAITNP